MPELTEYARCAIAHVYLDQAGNEVPFPGGKDDLGDTYSAARTEEYVRRRNLARAEWLRLRSEDGMGYVGAPSTAHMFHLGSGFVCLQVAVFTNAWEHYAEYETYGLMEEWIRANRPEELNDEGELDEVYMEMIPYEVDDIDTVR